MHCGQNVQLLNVKLLVHHVTGSVQKVNQYLSQNHTMTSCQFCPTGSSVCLALRTATSSRADSYLKLGKFSKVSETDSVPEKSDNFHTSTRLSAREGSGSANVSRSVSRIASKGSFNVFTGG